MDFFCSAPTEHRFPLLCLVSFFMEKLSFWPMKNIRKSKSKNPFQVSEARILWFQVLQKWRWKIIAHKIFPIFLSETNKCCWNDVKQNLCFSCLIHSASWVKSCTSEKWVQKNKNRTWAEKIPEREFCMKYFHRALLLFNTDFTTSQAIHSIKSSWSVFILPESVSYFTLAFFPTNQAGTKRLHEMRKLMASVSSPSSCTIIKRFETKQEQITNFYYL